VLQTYKHFEVIVVDDGSTEDLESVVTGMSDSRFKYVRQENGGASSARNNGFSKASGSWIALLDSDDHFLPQSLRLWSVKFD
jgi:glycosyltransferase involved in cell wall biosynthesis